MHGLDQNQPGETLVRHLYASQAPRNHSNDLASMIERGISQRTHQAHLRSTIDQAQSGLAE